MIMDHQQIVKRLKTNEVEEEQQELRPEDKVFMKAYTVIADSLLCITFGTVVKPLKGENEKTGKKTIKIASFDLVRIFLDSLKYRMALL
jgi:hypothetical protein